MGKNKMTKFEVSSSVKDMREKANQIAEEQGITNRDEKDAFRHA